MKAFVIFRDRVTYGRLCVDALAAAGLEPVVVDHGSTWEPAKDWLAELAAAGVPVMRKGGGHPRKLWDWALFRGIVGTAERYIVTDPDVIPADGCPLDWPDHLGWVLDEHPDATKAGLGLRIDNIPDSYLRHDQLIAWETRYWQYPVADGVYRADIDTTLALYRPLAKMHDFVLAGAFRTGPPYVADHLAWHEDLENPSEEIRYYYEHAEPGIAHWTVSGRSNFGN